MINSASRDYQEKRNYIRMKIDAPAAIMVSTQGASINGICRDLSGGGMLVELEETLPVGTETQITIASAHGHSPMLRAKAEVTRVMAQPDARENPCLLGLQIIEVLN